jgi:hypothetical protein
VSCVFIEAKPLELEIKAGWKIEAKQKAFRLAFSYKSGHVASFLFLSPPLAWALGESLRFSAFGLRRGRFTLLFAPQYPAKKQEARRSQKVSQPNKPLEMHWSLSTTFVLRCANDYA